MLISEENIEKIWIYLELELIKKGIVLSLLVNFNEFKERIINVKKINNSKIKREDMPIISYKSTDDLKEYIENITIDKLKIIQKIIEEENILDISFKNFIENNLPFKYYEKLSKKTKKDKIKANVLKIKAINLIPTQKELYISKIIKNIEKYGIPSKNNFITKRTLVVSKNNKILDGHHRWLSCMIINPNLELEVLKIDLTFEELYPLLLSYVKLPLSEENK